MVYTIYSFITIKNSTDDSIVRHTNGVLERQFLTDPNVYPKVMKKYSVNTIYLLPFKMLFKNDFKYFNLIT